MTISSIIGGLCGKSILRSVAVVLLVLAGLLQAVNAQASASGQVRVQITDAHGVPVSEAVVEIRPAAGVSGPIRFPWRMGMAQRDLKFTPGTLIVARGSTVAFPNLDRVRHSIYSFSKVARFEIDLYGRDQTRTHTFRTTGSARLGCIIHDGMRGYIRVTDTPFAAKTDRNGYVTFTGLPRGAAKATVWHPQLRAPANEHDSDLRIVGGSQSEAIKVALR
ncbi:MAG: methylamine utilization protein [Erythrobacter sp.]|jgi:hypothetical protein|nr:methylamine utilization protein [Erythrobacter sp.]